MVSRSLSYAVKLAGVVDPSLGQTVGRTNREIASTEAQIRDTREEQERLQRELRQTAQGTQAYDQLESQIRETRQETDRLTDELGRQQQAFDQINRRREQFGRIARTGALAIAGATAGLILYAENAGRSAQRLLDLERQTGITTDQLQRLQQQTKATGQELNPDQLLQFSRRLGQIQQESILAADGVKNLGASGESLLPASLALRTLGLDATQVSTQDLPLIIERLGQIEDISLRTALANDLLGRQLGASALSITELSEEARASIDQQLISSHEQLEAYAATRIEIQKFKNDLGEVTAAIGQAFLPALRAGFDALAPFVQAFATFAEANPQVLIAIAATGAAVVGITGAIWALNTALAVRAALSGPAGWAALGAAAAVGLSVGGLGAAAAANLNREQANIERLQEESIQGTAMATEEGAFRGTREAARLTAEETGNTLRNILPTCPEEGVADAIREGMAEGAREAAPPVVDLRQEVDAPTGNVRPSTPVSELAEILTGDNQAAQRFRGEVPGERPRDPFTNPDFAEFDIGIDQEIRRLRGLTNQYTGSVREVIRDLANELESTQLDLELDPLDRGALRAAATLTDASTAVTIEEIRVVTADPSEFVAELRGALETARLSSAQ